MSILEEDVSNEYPIEHATQHMHTQKFQNEQKNVIGLRIA